jgi:SAF domain-containing protein
MSIAVESPPESKTISHTAQRRWRMAALIGLVALLALVAFAVIIAEQNAQASRMVPVLKATRDIQAGTTITADELGVAYIRVNDDSVLANLESVNDRSSLVGQVATDGVRAGSLVPTGLGTPEVSANMWDVPLPVKQRPPDLKAGDHVALLVSGTGRSGQPVELVAAQDVRVLSVQQDSVDLWLPATSAAQLQLDASNGDLVLARMQPGTAQRNLQQAGGS